LIYSRKPEGLSKKKYIVGAKKTTSLRVPYSYVQINDTSILQIITSKVNK
jgi:hypothetical protein